MWVLKWSNPSEGDFDVALFTTQAEALKQSVAEIQMNIQSEWDMSDLDMARDAQAINEAVSKGDYTLAIHLFNNSDTNSEAENNRMYWSVFEISEHTLSSLTPKVFDPDFFDALSSIKEDESVVAPPTQKSPTTYQAATPGATCRGPRCGNYSEFTYADQPDGTYLCYQCKMMSSVFGGIQKP
jgi:hypothetical protein